MSATLEISPSTGITEEYKVADISLADFGRKEIEVAQEEMLASWRLAPSMQRTSLSMAFA